MKKIGFKCTPMLLCLSLCLGLWGLQPVTCVAGSSDLRRLSGSAFFDRGYSVYAVVEEASAGLFDVRIAIQFTPDFVTNDDIASYQLRLSNDQYIDAPAEVQQTSAAPTSFYTTAAIDAPLEAIQVIPVLSKSGRYDAEAFSIEQASDHWDAYIGTLATVRNPQGTSRLNLRYAPQDGAEVWMQYYNGAPLVITNVLPNNWVAVTVGDGAADYGTRGYMKADFLAFGNDAAQVTAAMPTYRSSSGFTLYNNPNESSQALATFNKGTDILVMGVSTSWYHAEVDGIEGYVKISALNASTEQSQQAKPTQTAASNQSAGSSQSGQTTLRLQTYSAKRNTEYGYTVDAVVTEVSRGQFIVNVDIKLPQDFMNDDVVAYKLYINGAFIVLADQVQQGAGAPTRFKGSFSFSGSISSMHVIPVLEKGGENTNDSEHIFFSIQ